MSASRVRTKERASIGLAAMCAGWFKEVGLQAEASGLGAVLQQDYARLVAFLGEHFGTVVAPGVISSVEEAIQAVAAFRRASVDVVVLVHIMWSEDQPLIALLEGCNDLPLVLWHYHPTGHLPAFLTTDDLFRRSGTVGALQGSAVLQRLGIQPLLVRGTPGNAALGRRLSELDRALAVRAKVKELAAGRIAGVCEVMTGTRVDEQALEGQLGVRLVEISAEEYASACEAVPAERARAFQVQVARAAREVRVCEESLQLACRNTLALDDLVAKYGLGVVAIQDLDPELHRLAGTRPCLCPPVSAEMGVAFGMESDVNATLGLFVAMHASGQPCMYTEIFSYDPDENVLLMGHAGVHDPRLASEAGVHVVPDYEYRLADKWEGAWQEFRLKPGPVTCVSLYDTGRGYRMTAFEGQSLPGPLRLQGFAHAVIRPDGGVEALLAELLQLGLTQHFAVAPGHLVSLLATWCDVSGVEFKQVAAFDGGR